MKQTGFKLLRKLPAAALASVVALGAGASSLPFAPSASAETQAPAAVPDFSNPAKMELVYLVEASMDSQNLFAQTSDHMEYWSVEEAQHKALETVANPDPSSADLFSARQQLEKALWAYDYRYITGKSDVERIMGRLGNAIYSKYPSSDPSYLTPWEKKVIEIIGKTYDLMNGMGDTHSGAVQAYQYFNIETSKLSYMLEPEFDRYRSSLAAQQAGIAEPLAVLAELGINVDDRVRDFDRSAAFLQALLNGGPYDKAVYDTATYDVQTYRYTISTAAELAESIDRLQHLADTSPRGIRSGQYPASAFGKLNRAINEAKHVLETAGSLDEMAYQIHFVLNRAEREFKNSVKP